ncbi:MAG: acetyltransferase [Oscillatoriophycideae cyanobacterium NC_groundwater_1537_Pr4_S-0.65um_50_18]|nr:acetyltransferase [Oscillatoriophycideae cyanobacterium NC_groundwater_1537_Pr4_S-0.65um_50_18]
MLLHNKDIKSLVEINDFQALIDPNQDEVTAQSQSGEEEQDPEPMQKKNLIFPSGEDLPRCWVDANYESSK